MHNSNVAAGQTLLVTGASLNGANGETLSFNGAAELDGRFTVIGGSGNDSISGGQKGDHLQGRDGDDALDGSGGNDTLIGGLGSDTLRGGEGKDFFRFESADAATTVAGKEDRIVDFETGLDRIDLSAIDAGSAAGDQAFKFLGAEAFSASGGGGEIRATAYGSSGMEWLVEGDLDGDGTADFAMIVTGFTTQPLAAGDFIL
jgi:Ca2+-binding RTX toxin-like protein